MNRMTDLLDKYESLPAGVKASAAFAVCSVLQKGIQFFTIPLFTKILTTEQYGQYSVFQSWYSIICIFATLNLSGGCFNNGMLKYPEDRDGYISSMQGLSTSVTIIVFFVYMLFQSFWNSVFKLPSFVMYAVFLYLLFSPSVTFWSAKQRYEYKYIALVVFTLIFTLLDPLIGLITVSRATEKGIARILSVCFVNAFTGLLFYCLNFAHGRKIYQKDYWLFALKFNLPLVPHYLSQIVLGQSDRIMIEKMAGTSAVAIYSIAYNIGMVMNIFVTSINASFVPWTFDSIKNERFRDISKISNGLVLLIGILSLIPIMFAPEAVRILGTEEYLDAVWVIPPVAISSLLTFIYSLFGNIEFYYERSKFVMTATVTAALANIGLNYVCIKIFGYIAASITTFVCYGLMVVMHYLFMCKIVDENGVGRVYDIKFILMALGGIIIISPVFMALYSTSIVRYILILTLFIVIIFKKGYFIGLIKTLRSHD